MGCFYTGFDYYNRVNGYFKIGETEKQTPAARWATIRHYDHFQGLAYLVLKGETKSERLFVESYVRMKFEKFYKQTQNDHFLYTIEKGRKYEQANEMSEQAIALAIEACEIAGINWERGTKTYKRG